MAQPNLRNLLPLQVFNSLRCCPRSKVSMPKLATLIRSPRVDNALSWNNNSKSPFGNLKLLNVKCFPTLYAMRVVKLAKSSFSPNIELSFRRDTSRKSACSYSDHFAERKFLQKCWKTTSLWRRSGSQLPSGVCAHCVNFSFQSQNNRVFVSTGDLRNLIRNPIYVAR